MPFEMKSREAEGLGSRMKGHRSRVKELGSRVRGFRSRVRGGSEEA